jgi:hypothetical protein
MKYVNAEKQLKLIRLLLPKDTSETIFDIIKSSLEIAYIDGKIDVYKSYEKDIYNRKNA